MAKHEGFLTLEVPVWGVGGAHNKDCSALCVYNPQNPKPNVRELSSGETLNPKPDVQELSSGEFNRVRSRKLKKSLKDETRVASKGIQWLWRVRVQSLGRLSRALESFNIYIYRRAI